VNGPPPHQTGREQVQTPWRLLVLLMAMTAIGPTSLNIVVPAVPSLSRRLASDLNTVQMTVSLFIVGLALAQLVHGPLSDRLGRRPVVLAGLVLMITASLAAIAATSVAGLIGARIVQAVGAATGIVIGRAVIRDLFERDRAAAMFGLVTTAMVIAPTFGPLIGGILDTLFGWEAIFVFMALAGLGLVLWTAAVLPETRPVLPGGGFLVHVKDLVGSRLFWGYVLCGAFGSGTFFAFLGGGPYVVVSMMGRTSAEYGVWFALSSAGYMAGNFAASRLSLRIGVDAMIRWGLLVEALGTACSLVLTSFAHELGPLIIFLPQLVIAIGNGLMLPNAIAGAVSIRPLAAGTASGLMGCVQMLAGAAFVQLGGAVLAHASSALPLSFMLGAIVSAYAAAFFLLVRKT
jgi:DHA1 family bicyclomycin/chloramphenicol resistance-like MFS transporter